MFCDESVPNSLNHKQNCNWFSQIILEGHLKKMTSEDAMWYLKWIWY